VLVVVVVEELFAERAGVVDVVEVVGEAGQYLRVLNAASLSGLSLLTWGREWLRATSRSMSSWATDLLVIEVPRSACTTFGLP